jgi:hypothetical protein
VMNPIIYSTKTKQTHQGINHFLFQRKVHKD